MVVDYESYELLIEDKFFPRSHIKFSKTSTFMLMVDTVNGEGDEPIGTSIILTEDDVESIREFLKHWDEE